MFGAQKTEQQVCEQRTYKFIYIYHAGFVTVLCKVVILISRWDLPLCQVVLNLRPYLTSQANTLHDDVRSTGLNNKQIGMCIEKRPQCVNAMFGLEFNGNMQRRTQQHSPGIQQSVPITYHFLRSDLIPVSHRQIFQ